MKMIAAAAAVLLLGACDAPHPPPAPLSAAPRDLLQGLQAPAAFVYQNDAARDPFADQLSLPASPEGPDSTETSDAARARRPPDSLHSVGLRQLRWLGSITVADQRYGLLQTPDGSVHRAGLHERIGTAAAEIIAIDAQGLQLRDAHGQSRLPGTSQREGVQR